MIALVLAFLLAGPAWAGCPEDLAQARLDRDATGEYAGLEAGALKNAAGELARAHALLSTQSLQSPGAPAGAGPGEGGADGGAEVSWPRRRETFPPAYLVQELHAAARDGISLRIESEQDEPYWRFAPGRALRGAKREQARVRIREILRRLSA